MQILKIAKSFCNFQYLFTLSDFVAMKPQTCDDSQLRRLVLRNGFHTTHDFARLDRDAKVEISVEVD